VTIALLIGALTAKNKREIHQLIVNGEIDIVIGTHAIIQKEVEFKKLGFVVVDEQHRFGVASDLRCVRKGRSHVLAMTATHTADPRFDHLRRLDLSVIDELPPGRQLIKTSGCARSAGKCYRFIRKEIAAGHQALFSARSSKNRKQSRHGQQWRNMNISHRTYSRI